MRDAEPFEQKVERLTREFDEQFAESSRLGESISASLALLPAYPTDSHRPDGKPST